MTTITSIGIFHYLPLVRSLAKDNSLVEFWTGYPRYKLSKEGIPGRALRTFPWYQLIYLAKSRHIKRSFGSGDRLFQLVCYRTFDRHVSKHMLPCETYVGQARVGTCSSKKAKEYGAKVICDSGSTHILEQLRILEAENARWGSAFDGLHAEAVRRELEQYAIADRIMVMSELAKLSFIVNGVPASKMAIVRPGVDLKRFYPQERTVAKGCNVLYIGNLTLRKGIPYLLSAFERVPCSDKSLTLVGTTHRDILPMITGMGDSRVYVLGHRPQTDLPGLIAAAGVLVLPSVEDGFGMVVPQAMACGCPVIVSDRVGAADVVREYDCGIVYPYDDIEALSSAIMSVCSSAALRDELSEKGLGAVRRLGGWDSYVRDVRKVITNT